MQTVGFEPTPFRNAALTHRLRPLGQICVVKGLTPSHSLKVVVPEHILVLHVFIFSCLHLQKQKYYD